jgi:hypothetical protein
MGWSLWLPLTPSLSPPPSDVCDPRSLVLGRGRRGEGVVSSSRVGVAGERLTPLILSHGLRHVNSAEVA